MRTVYNGQNVRTQNMIKTKKYFLMYFVMVLTDKMQHPVLTWIIMGNI